MMSYDTARWMMGGYAGGAYVSMWFMYSLMTVLAVLAIVALWKYINKK